MLDVNLVQRAQEMAIHSVANKSTANAVTSGSPMISYMKVFGDLTSLFLARQEFGAFADGCVVGSKIIQEVNSVRGALSFRARSFVMFQPTPEKWIPCNTFFGGMISH